MKAMSKNEEAAWRVLVENPLLPAGEVAYLAKVPLRVAKKMIEKISTPQEVLAASVAAKADTGMPAPPAAPPLAHRAVILRTAEDCISRDRAKTYGPAENSFAEIAAVWNWWLGSRLGQPLTPFDVAMMMGLFKDARIKGNPTHDDNYIDGCGYRALAAEIARNRGTGG